MGSIDGYVFTTVATCNVSKDKGLLYELQIYIIINVIQWVIT